MKQLSSAQIRQMFLDYFTEKGHRVEPSAPLVPKDDPTLLWINSGVATLKKYFDISVIPYNSRILKAQKTIRTNDIENVGYTARHHTFFEMLGNFSIGDYFKKEAIDFAWEFLTSEKWLGLQEELLTVTVHPEDDEAYDIWLDQMNLPKHRIIRLEENFWDIGVGPSGPNTEIFYGRGEAFGNDPNDPELYPGGENNRYLEVWNLVFSQFNHNPDDTYTPLPNKNIDTGMGLERVASIMQEVPSNYDTDLFMPIIMETEKLATKKYGVNKQDDTAFKVIADHIRTVAFAIGDHALPSNEGRGYVLRRLLRRAVRFAKQIGIEKPFMYKLVPTVGIIMHDYYPEVINQKDEIEKIIKIEEERFHETLYDGLAMLTSIIEKEKKKDRTIFPGIEVFKLYDTYGFPKELTEEYVAEQGFSIDEAGFESEMEKQRERARSARQDVQSMDVQDEVLGSIDVESEFIGYNQLEVKTKVEAMIKDKQRVETAQMGDEIIVFLHETPFYAESGGQINDQGWIETEHGVGEVLRVSKSPKGQHIHQVKVTSGQLTDQDVVIATVDKNKRNGIVKSHTATHLLHQVLRDVLGDNVAQSGSLVTDNRLRFDFSHFGSISVDELSEIEQQVNEKIWRSIPVTITNQEIKAAKDMEAMALFGEKYGDIVRVVQIGDYSIELCGGCHVENTAEIGLFKILTESGIGAGTRRIEAVTSKGAYEQLTSKIDVLNTSAEQLNTSDEQVPQKIEALFQDLKRLKEQNDSLSSQMANVETKTIVQKVKKVQDINLVAERVNVTDMNQLRNMVDDVKQKIGSGVFILAAESNKKVLLVAGVSKDLNDRGLHAGNLIKRAAEQCGGGGGGRPDMAQAGGKDPEKIDAALNIAEKYIDEKIEQ